MKGIRLFINYFFGAIFGFIFLVFLVQGIINVILAEGKAAEAETKSNSHTIQIALEKYSEDYGGFPSYILGGDKEGWEYYNANRKENEPEIWDPLLKGGYLESYPENAFFGGSGKIRKAMEKFRGQVKSDSDGKFDPRFGLNGDKMGNALCGPIIFVEQWRTELKDYPRICPGQFYYASFSDGDTPEDCYATPFDEGFQPGSQKTHYLIGAFGYLKSEGNDRIRWKTQSGDVPSQFPYISPDEYYETSTGVATEFNLRLPEALSFRDKPGLPVWPPSSLQNVDGELVFDGIPDGVIMVLLGSTIDDGW